MCGRTVITVLLFTGLQISELAALGLGDLAVSAIEMLVTVRRGKCTDSARPPRTTSTLRRSSTGKRTVRRRQGARLVGGSRRLAPGCVLWWVHERAPSRRSLTLVTCWAPIVTPSGSDSRGRVHGSEQFGGAQAEPVSYGRGACADRRGCAGGWLWQFGRDFGSSDGRGCQAISPGFAQRGCEPLGWAGFSGPRAGGEQCPG